MPWVLGFVLAAITLGVSWWARQNYYTGGWLSSAEDELMSGIAFWGSLAILFMTPLIMSSATGSPRPVGPAWPVVESIVLVSGAGFAWFQMFVTEVGSEHHMTIAHASASMSWASAVDKCVRAIRVREWGRALARLAVGLVALPFAYVIVCAVVYFE